VIALLTASGAQVEEVRYSPYGEPFGMYAGDVDTADRNTVNANIGKNLGWGAQSHSSTASRRGYAGSESGLANVGLQHVRFRAYRTDLGRWVSRDPLGFDGLQPLYAYVTNAAIAQIDPLGLAGVVPPAVPIQSHEVRPDDAGPPLAPPGSGLELGFVACPGFQRFGGVGPAPGVTPIPDSDWYVLEPAEEDRKRLAPWYGRRPWEESGAGEGSGTALAMTGAIACRPPSFVSNVGRVAGFVAKRAFVPVAVVSGLVSIPLALQEGRREQKWYEEQVEKIRPALPRWHPAPPPPPPWPGLKRFVRCYYFYSHCIWGNSRPPRRPGAGLDSQCSVRSVSGKLPDDRKMAQSMRDATRYKMAFLAPGQLESYVARPRLLLMKARPSLAGDARSGVRSLRSDDENYNVSISGAWPPANR
jgi:RHS repeat-associated protein